MKYLNRFRVAPGSKVKLKNIDAGFKDSHDNHKDAAEEIEHYQTRLRELQELLYADRRRSVLLCLQALDTGGKDGTINHILGSMNPQGCKVVGFKQPSAEESTHDFLWRIHRAAPARGEVAIFNRSHYEDVLIARVHNLVPKEIRSCRYDRINAFENGLVEDGTQILKFYLHISKEEQLKRLQGPARRPSQAMENQRGRLQGTHLLGRLHRRLRGCAIPLQHRACPLVYHSRQPQMVPEPGGGPHRRGALGSAEDDLPEALGRYRAHSPRISLGKEA